MTGAWLGPIAPAMASVCTQGNLTTPWLQYLKLCHWLYDALMCLSPTYFHPFPVTLLTTLPTSPFFCAFSWGCAITTLLYPVALTTLLPLLHTQCFDPSCSSCCRIVCLHCSAPDPTQITLPWCPSLNMSQSGNKWVYEEHLKSFHWSRTTVLLRYLVHAFKVHPVVSISPRPWEVFSVYHKSQATVYSSHINCKWTEQRCPNFVYYTTSLVTEKSRKWTCKLS